MKTLRLNPYHEFTSHSWNLFNLRFSPDGSMLVIATLENDGVLIVNTNTWSVERRLPEASFPPTSLAFSPDGKSLVMTMGQQRPTYCWDLPNGKVRWSQPKVGMHAVFSADGRRVATTKSKSVLLLDSATGRILHQMDGHTSRVDVTDFSLDGRRVASAGRTQVWLWDANTGEPVRVAQDKQGQVPTLAFSPSGDLLATVSQSGGVRVYDSYSGAKLIEFEGHQDMAWDLAFAKDEGFLVTVGFDRFVRIWDLADESRTRSIELPEGITCGRFALSPDSRIVAVPMNHPIHEVRLFSVETGMLLAVLPIDGLLDPQVLLKVRASPQELAFSPNGDWLAVACDDGKTRIWELAELPSER